jgi:hypothetical protein
MSKINIFKDLITELNSSGELSPEHYELLLLQGKDLGLSKNAVDLMIEMNKKTNSNQSENSNTINNPVSIENRNKSDEIFEFKSAITRGGNILTPDILIISSKTVTYKKRNKYLINVDTMSIPISKISSVSIDTSVLGTDIVIKSFGSGNIVVKKFTKTDALTIKKLIEERQE